MIDREEIDRVAATLSVGPTDIERDYVNGWILAGIFEASELASDLVLKGGNALRKGYFPNTRYSKDLDFTAPRGIDRDKLRAETLRVTRFVAEQTGVEFIDDAFAIVEPPRIANVVEVIEVRAYFRDFYGRKRTLPIRVYMDVTEFDRIMLPTCERQLIHPYSDGDAAMARIQCVAVEEILASKLKCLLQRRKASDLFDYVRWVVFDDLPVDLVKVLDVFLQQTIYGRAPGAAFDLLVNLPVIVFQELWARHVVSPATCFFEFADGLDRFKNHLAALFGERREWKPYRLSFFPPELREPIMSAGRQQHLMRLMYDGAERIVEPYALKFKVAKDRGGREYFFAYDRTGGNSGVQSIKTFVAEKIRSLVELEERFEPRFEVEVAQAGDVPKDLRFRGRSRTGFVPGFGITRRSGRPTRRRSR